MSVRGTFSYRDPIWFRFVNSNCISSLNFWAFWNIFGYLDSLWKYLKLLLSFFQNFVLGASYNFSLFSPLIIKLLSIFLDFWTSKFIVLLLCFVSFLIWCQEVEIFKWKEAADVILYRLGRRKVLCRTGQHAPRWLEAGAICHRARHTPSKCTFSYWGFERKWRFLARALVNNFTSPPPLGHTPVGMTQKPVWLSGTLCGFDHILANLLDLPEIKGLNISKAPFLAMLTLCFCFYNISK